MSIDYGDLIQNSISRETIKTDFQKIETSLNDGILWSCALTEKGIEIVNNTDSFLTKIWFIVRNIFGFIDTSPATFLKLQRDVKVAEENAYNTRITGLTTNIAGLAEQQKNQENALRVLFEEQEKQLVIKQNLETSLAEIESNRNSASSEFQHLNQQISAAQAKKREIESQLALIANTEKAAEEARKRQVEKQEAFIVEVESLTQQLEQKKVAIEKLQTELS